MNPTLERYHQLAYPGRPYLFTHPARLAGLSALAGGPVPPVQGARILELGCGDGVNLISLAGHIEGVTCVGVDGAPDAIETAREIVAATGLTGIRFEVADLAEYVPDGEYDYVLAHGVYSWVGPDIRDALMRVVSAALAPGGLAYVSYNITPGWHLRNVVRDAMVFAAENAREPHHQVRDAAGFAREMARRLPEDVVHGRVFRTYAESVALDDAPFVFHDYLAPENTPIPFAEFYAHCHAHELRWLMESAAADLVHPTLPEELRDLVLGQPETLARETLLDHAYGRDFRRSILTRAGAPVPHRHPSSETFQHLHVALRSPAPDTIDIREDEPLEMSAGRGTTTLVRTHTKAMVALLGACYPASRPIADLPLLIDEVAKGYADHPTDPDDLAARLLELAASEALDILSEPRYEPTPDPDRPVAYRLAAHELRRGRGSLTNRLHMSVSLDDLDRLVVLLSDGRTREAIVERAVRAVMNHEIALLDEATRTRPADELHPFVLDLVNARIDRLGRVGLMEDATTSPEEN